jgi:hypothetical protein
MTAAFGGVGLLVAALALLRQFRPRDGQVVNRSEWIDITVAISVTSGLTFGVMLIVVGISGWFV